MKVTSVTFRGMVQLEPYNMAHVEMSASVDKGETPQAALTKLKAVVARELAALKTGQVVNVPRRVRFTDQVREISQQR